jgi:hypothetical protein
MDDFTHDNESTYITASVQGDDLCAKIVLIVKESTSGIEDIVEREGLGYRGAELKELEFDIIQSKTDTDFIFRKVSSVVD